MTAPLKVTSIDASAKHRACGVPVSGREHIYCGRPTAIRPGESDRLTAVFASWSRALTGARPENRLRIFQEMARDAAALAAAERQGAIDAMQLVAKESGVAALVGDTYVQAALALAFDGGR
jgi:hypothetical protein